MISRHPVTVQQGHNERVILSRRTLVASLAACLAGCGFELRRAPELNFKTIQLVGFKAHSPLAEELKRHIATSTTTKVVEAASLAEVVLEASTDAQERVVVASTIAGQVREVQFQQLFRFSLRTPAGHELIGLTVLTQKRDMTYNESNALAKGLEEEQLFKSMRSDIATQVLRRLAAVKLA